MSSERRRIDGVHQGRTPHLTSLRWGGTILELSSEALADVVWASRHFYADAHLDAPVSDGASAMASVAARLAEPAELESLRASAESCGTTLTVRDFIESEYHLHELENGDRAWVRSRGGGEVDHVLVQPHEGRNWVIHHVDTKGTPFRALTRVARELVRQNLLSVPSVPLHAAAVSDAEQGVLLVGASGAGKTTLALGLVCRGWSFLSNERSYIHRDGGGFTLNGFPAVVRVGVGTARMLRLDSGLETNATRPQEVFDASGGVSHAATERNSRLKFEITNFDVASRLGGPCRSSAPLAAVVVLEACETDQPTLHPVDVKSAFEALKSQMFDPDPSWPDDWLQVGRQFALDERTSIIRSLFAAVPVVRLRWRPGQLDEAHGLLDGLL
jgi:hypothetical protein